MMISTRSHTFPLPSNQSIEVDFIENREVELQRAGIERNYAFDSEKKRFVAQATVQEISYDDTREQVSPLELQRTRDELQSAIDHLKERKGKKNDVIAKFELSDPHSWADVVGVLTEVEVAYLNKDTVSGKVRAACRTIGERGKSIKPFLQMLPDGSYKTLCGGLTLVLTAMIKKSEIRQKMADVLNELPMVVQECEDYAQMYRGDNSIKRCTEKLYIELVDVIADMVRWYTQSSFKRSAGAILHNDDYANSIDERIKNISMAKKAFEKETNKYLHWRTDAIHHTVQETNESVFVIGNMMCESKTQLQNVEQAVNGVYDLLQDHTKKQQRNLEKEALQKETQDLRARMQELESQLQQKSLQLQERTLRAQALAYRLHFNLPTDAYFDDIERSLSNGVTSSSKFHAKTKQIVSAKRYAEWHQCPTSAVLCINGNWQQDALSPTSFLSALLTTSQQKQNNFVLYFSCGLHTSSVDIGELEVGGPLLLLRTLLAQILSIKDIDDRQWLSAINPNDIETLGHGSFEQYLDLFLNLVENVSRTYDGLVIIIDSIDYYHHTWKKQVKKLIKSLESLTDEASSSRRLIKVLIMASSRSPLFRKAQDISVLDMPDELEADGSDLEGS